MSWDLTIQDLPPGIASVAEIPDDFRPRPLGPRAEILGAIRRVLPRADGADERWIRVDTSDVSMEIDVGEDDPVLSVGLFVRGGADPHRVIRELLDVLGARALDPGSPSGLFDAEDTTSFDEWRAFKDRRLGRQGP